MSDHSACDPFADTPCQHLVEAADDLYAYAYQLERSMVRIPTPRTVLRRVLRWFL